MVRVMPMTSHIFDEEGEVMVDFAHEGTGPVPKENANARWTSRYHDLKMSCSLECPRIVVTAVCTVRPNKC